MSLSRFAILVLLVGLSASALIGALPKHVEIFLRGTFQRQDIFSLASEISGVDCRQAINRVEIQSFVIDESAAKKCSILKMPDKLVAVLVYSDTGFSLLPVMVIARNVKSHQKVAIYVKGGPRGGFNFNTGSQFAEFARASVITIVPILSGNNERSIFPSPDLPIAVQELNSLQGKLLQIKLDYSMYGASNGGYVAAIACAVQCGRRLFMIAPLLGSPAEVFELQKKYLKPDVVKFVNDANGVTQRITITGAGSRLRMMSHNNNGRYLLKPNARIIGVGSAFGFTSYYGNYYSTSLATIILNSKADQNYIFFSPGDEKIHVSSQNFYRNSDRLTIVKLPKSLHADSLTVACQTQKILDCGQFEGLKPQPAN